MLDKLTYAGNLANLAPVADDPRLQVRRRATSATPRWSTSWCAGHDAVVHFAAESHVDRSIPGAADFVTPTCWAPRRCSTPRCAHGVGRFVHVSTDEVYGSIDDGLLDRGPAAARRTRRTPPPRPARDLLALAYHRTHGLDVVVTRCSNNYGPYQFPEKVIPLFVTNLLDGRQVPLYGDGGNVRDWLHVDDHCRGIQLVAARGPGRRGLQHRRRHRADQQGADRAAARGAAARTGTRVEHVEDRKGHDRRYSLDITKIRDELGYAPQVTFEQGLADDRRLVPGQPRLVGAAEGARRRCDAAGWSPARAGCSAGTWSPCCAHGASKVTAPPAPTWTSPTPRRSRAAVPGTTS